eukprot:15444647-Alexandrium_andersonii.AAC.1
MDLEDGGLRRPVVDDRAELGVLLRELAHVCLVEDLEEAAMRLVLLALQEVALDGLARHAEGLRDLAGQALPEQIHLPTSGGGGSGQAILSPSNANLARGRQA